MPRMTRTLGLLRSPVARYIIIVSILALAGIALVAALPTVRGSDAWQAIASAGQALEAYVVLVSAGAIYFQLTRRKEETIQHRVQVFEFLRSTFHGEAFERWFRVLVAYGRGRPIDFQSQRHHEEMLVSPDEISDMARDVLATFDVINRFIQRGDLALDDLVEYQGDRLWELHMAFQSLELQPRVYNAGWGRRQARDLLEQAARAWRTRGEQLGSGTFPHTWP